MEMSQFVKESMQRMADRTYIESPIINNDKKAMEAIKLLIAHGYTKEDVASAWDALDRIKP